MLKLNIGCGNDKRIGWENIDENDGQDMYFLDYKEGTVDAILFNHVAMYVRPNDMKDLLNMFYTWLRKGGTVHMETQDFFAIEDPETMFGMGENAGHQWAWTPENLREMMVGIGFDVYSMPVILHGKPERDFLICGTK